jgi:hypothetical protein
VTSAAAVIVKLHVLSPHGAAGPVPAENFPGTWPGNVFAANRIAEPDGTWNVHCAVGLLQSPPLPMTATVPWLGPTRLMVRVNVVCASAADELARRNRHTADITVTSVRSDGPIRAWQVRVMGSPDFW